MKRTLLILLLVAAVISIALFVPSEIALCEIINIPDDKSKMDDVKEEYYISDTEYQDPSLHITLERGKYEDTNYLVIRITVANATQLRTAVSYNGKARESDRWWVSHINPVLAINGDGFGDNFNGLGRHIVRQGKLYKSNAGPNRFGFNGFDALIIDDKGDFHIIRNASEEDFEQFEWTIVNCFSFGPGLVIDGELITDFLDDNTYQHLYGGVKRARRICIAQTGELSYMIIQTDGPDDPDKTGLDIVRFAKLVHSLGAQNAYNLDGGSSTRVLFHGVSIDSPYPNTKSQKRNNGDIIYFASAYQENETGE